MSHLRNALLFIGFALIISGCGGGSGTIANATSGGSTGTNSGGTSGSIAGSSSGSIALQWVPPSTLADGATPVSPSDISGYRIFYGNSPTYTPNVIMINDGTKTQVSITLASGTYYFVICAIDSNGNPGLKSGAIQKTI